LILGNKLEPLDEGRIFLNFYTSKSSFVSIAKSIIGDDGDNLPKVLRFPRKDLTSIFAAMEYPTIESMFETAKVLSENKKITPRAYQLLVDNVHQIRKTYALASLREDVAFTQENCVPNELLVSSELNRLGCATLIPRLGTFFRGSL